MSAAKSGKSPKTTQSSTLRDFLNGAGIKFCRCGLPTHSCEVYELLAAIKPVIEVGDIYDRAKAIIKKHGAKHG